MADQAEDLRKMMIEKYRKETGHVSIARLTQIHTHLTDGRQFQRGVDGFEVPHWVLPMSPAEASDVICELITKRMTHGT